MRDHPMRAVGAEAAVRGHRFMPQCSPEQLWSLLRGRSEPTMTQIKTLLSRIDSIKLTEALSRQGGRIGFFLPIETGNTS